MVFSLIRVSIFHTLNMKSIIKLINCYHLITVEIHLSKDSVNTINDVAIMSD